MTGDKELLLLKTKLLLEKFSVKGGWTYVQLDEIKPSKDTPFGWVRVKGRIDDYSFSNYRIMPMGNGKLFLPVNAKVRKQIKKEAGDYIEVELYKDDTPNEIPEEITLCLKEDDLAFDAFQKKSDGQKKALIDWIYGAKTDETKIHRIAKMMNDLIK